MASLYISEYEMVGDEQRGYQMVAGREPGVTTQKVTFSTSTASSAFDSRTRYVRITADAACHLSFGSSPTATTNDLPMQANAPEYFAVISGQKVAAVTQ